MNVFCALSLFNKGRKYTYIYVFKLYTSFEWHLIIQIIIIIFWRNSKTICIKGKRTSSVQSKLLWRGELRNLKRRAFQRKGAEEGARSPHVWCSVLGGTERRGRDLNWVHWGSRSLRRFGGGSGGGDKGDEVPGSTGEHTSSTSLDGLKFIEDPGRCALENAAGMDQGQPFIS